jgi:hypothetical protein
MAEELEAYEAADYQDPLRVLILKEETGMQVQAGSLFDRKRWHCLDFLMSNKKRYEVLKIRFSHPAKSIKQISEITGVHRDTIAKYLQQLKNNNKEN